MGEGLAVTHLSAQGFVYFVYFQPPVQLIYRCGFSFFRKWFGLCVEAEGMTKEDFQFKQPPIHW